MPDDEIELAAHWQMAKELDCKTSDIRIAAFDVGEMVQAGHCGREVMVAAHSVKDLEAHAEMLKRAGLIPDAIEPVPVAVARIISHSDDGRRCEATHFVIVIGATESIFMIVCDGVPVFVRSIAIGRQHLCDRLAIQLSLNEAQQDVLRARLEGDESSPIASSRAESNVSDPVTDHAIRAACTGVANEMSHEVIRCIQYQSSVLPGVAEPSIGCIVGAGHLEMIFVDAMTEASGIQFQRLADILSPTVRTWLGALSGESSIDRWILPLGLAMRSAEGRAPESGRRHWNLLPVESHPAHRVRAWRVSQRLLVVGVVVVAALWLITAGLQVRSLNADITAMEQTLEPLRRQSQLVDRLTDERGALSTQLQMVRTIRDPIPTAAILALLSRVLPGEMVLQKLSFEVPGPVIKAAPKSQPNTMSQVNVAKPARLELHGMTTDDAAISRVISALGEAGLRDVWITQNHEMTGTDERLRCFQLSINIPLTEISAHSIAGVTLP